MATDQNNKSDQYINNGVFCFLEFFFISSGNKNQPTSIYDQKYTHEHEKTIEKFEDFSKNL